MQKIISMLSRLDWVVGAGTLVFGLITGTIWLVAVGLVSLVVAWINPSARIQAYAKRKLIAKSTQSSDSATVQAADAFYAENIEDSGDVSPTPSYTGLTQWGPVVIGASRHNVVRPPHFNLYRALTSKEPNTHG